MTPYYNLIEPCFAKIKNQSVKKGMAAIVKRNSSTIIIVAQN